MSASDIVPLTDEDRESVLRIAKDLRKNSSAPLWTSRTPNGILLASSIPLNSPSLASVLPGLRASGYVLQTVGENEAIVTGLRSRAAGEDPEQPGVDREALAAARAEVTRARALQRHLVAEDLVVVVSPTPNLGKPGRVKQVHADGTVEVTHDRSTGHYPRDAVMWIGHVPSD